MITLIEFKKFIEEFIKCTNNVNITTLDKYINNYDFTDLIHKYKIISFL